MVTRTRLNITFVRILPVLLEFILCNLCSLAEYPKNSMEPGPSWEEIPRILWNPKLYNRILKRPSPLVHILSQKIPIHFVMFNFFNANFSILQFTPQLIFYIFFVYVPCVLRIVFVSTHNTLYIFIVTLYITIICIYKIYTAT